MKFQRIIASAKASLQWNLEACFEAWTVGDALGVHRFWRAARRCEHVIRLARALAGEVAA